MTANSETGVESTEIREDSPRLERPRISLAQWLLALVIASVAAGWTNAIGLDRAISALTLICMWGALAVGSLLFSSVRRFEMTYPASATLGITAMMLGCFAASCMWRLRLGQFGAILIYALVLPLFAALFVYGQSSRRRSQWRRTATVLVMAALQAVAIAQCAAGIADQTWLYESTAGVARGVNLAAWALVLPFGLAILFSDQFPNPGRFRAQVTVAMAAASLVHLPAMWGAIYYSGASSTYYWFWFVCHPTTSHAGIWGGLLADVWGWGHLAAWVAETVAPRLSAQARSIAVRLPGWLAVCCAALALLVVVPYIVGLSVYEQRIPGDTVEFIGAWRNSSPLQRAGLLIYELFTAGFFGAIAQLLLVRTPRSFWWLAGYVLVGVALALFSYLLFFA